MMAKDAKPAEEGVEAPPKKSKKLLIIILAVVLLLVLGGGAAAVLLLKGGSHADEDEEVAEETAKPKKKDKKAEAPPVFVNMDPFTVNWCGNRRPIPAGRAVARTGGCGCRDGYQDADAEDPQNITLLLSSKKASELLPRKASNSWPRRADDEINGVIEPRSATRRARR
jgi:flagellar FliL protein